jgi:hypothetical protein
MIIPNIDTVFFGVNFYEYDMYTEEIIDKFEKLKVTAKKNDEGLKDQMPVYSSNNMNFEVFGNGKRGYAYILHNSEYELNIAQYSSRIESFYPVIVRIKSEALWSIGLNRIIQQNNKVVGCRNCRL